MEWNGEWARREEGVKRVAVAVMCRVVQKHIDWNDE